MIKGKNILVTGGAGYIGSVLVRLLLSRGYFVRVIDNLTFGGGSIADLIGNDNFEFVRGDIRNHEDLEKSTVNIDHVVHLASIVGDPACAKDPELTTSVNLLGAKLAYQASCSAGAKRFIFASTCSNYGKMEDSSTFLDEESELNPVSLYAKTKVDFEKYLMSLDRGVISKPTCLRFSTVYGLSPRLRFDLTVNEFTKELALDRELIVFGKQFWRPYCHVDDLARGVIATIEADVEKVAFNVYNVGDTSENYQKQMIVDKIKEMLPNSKIEYVKKDEDPRDYRVSFEKIKKELNFKITRRVADGVRDIIQIVKDGIIEDLDNPKYKNV